MFHVKHFCLKKDNVLFSYGILHITCTEMQKRKEKNMQKIYTVEQPKIHLSEVIGYGPENKIYIISNDIFFGNKEELIRFLARALERPHPTDVGWGFYGLAPVKPR